jgi:hypothetical protein
VDKPGFERINPHIAGRPQLIRGNVQLLFPGMRVRKTCDVGAATGLPASPDYVPTGNASNGEIHWVQLDIDDDDHNHRTSLGAREIGHCVGVGKATRNA